MITYILRRLLISVPLLIGISFITFMFIQLAPGNYFDTLRMNPEISEEIIAQYEAQYHLDQPPVVQYLHWLTRLLQGDMGYSFSFRAPVAAVIGSRIGNTLILTMVAMILTWLFAIPMGIWAAVRQHRPADRLISFLAFVGMSVPNFFLALLLLYAASQVAGWPLGGMRSMSFSELSASGQLLDLAKHLCIPALVI